MTRKNRFSPRRYFVASLIALVPAAAMSFCCAVAAQPNSAQQALDRIERKIVKEPPYESAPKYGLIVLGTSAASQVWMVEDGNRLYVDKNANRDLTDDGPPVEPSDVRDLGKTPSGGNRRDWNYVVDTITTPDGTRHTHFDLRRWNYGEKGDSYGLSLTVEDRLTMYAGWFRTFWSATPDAVPMIHFGGPLEPHVLRRKEFVVGAARDRLSLAFTNPGRGDGATSRLSIDALPKSVVPRLTIDWPVADGAPALQLAYPLADRCCYWEFYELNFLMPPGVVPGEATLTVSFDGGEFPVPLTTDQMKVPVLPQGARTSD